MFALYPLLTTPVWSRVSRLSSGEGVEKSHIAYRVLEALTGDATDSDGTGSAAADSNDTGEETRGAITRDRPIRTDGGRNRQDQQSATRAQADDGSAISITFRDRETVRIVGDLETVLLSLCWWDESGLLGTITEPIGGVSGERVVTASEAFDDQTFAYGPVVTGVEGFTTAGPSVPGTGDVAASNPDVEAHVETVRDEYDGPGDLEAAFPDGN